MSEAVEARYYQLAESECCLSCGGAAAACMPAPVFCDNTHVTAGRAATDGRGVAEGGARAAPRW